MAPAIEYLDGKVRITTGRLLLRPALENDAEALYEAFHDRKVMLYWYSISVAKRNQADPHG